ncbi:nuclear transport factor 2 family protein [Mucilaginibacter dorajii]|uniref:DUF4440 domain-containing protein n=1 Tax=Mucilaginibacter dorajii TaxID=692994 RepID=A0ABP7Q1A9_9SPHI|nr:nuclear transport factor 2 family protein [Mucilaginibacter dorajii]MCS3732838.1 hypothetical protein [Mucilaginibacter dorajii]
MKLIIAMVVMLSALTGYAQSPAEVAALKLSARVFTWEVDNKIDSLHNVFDAKFIAYTSSGDHQLKEQYIATLKSGKVVHNSINIEESRATVASNTATVGGKGKFTITVNGNQKIIHLSYLEVFIRKDERSPWKMLALHAGLLPN